MRTAAALALAASVALAAAGCRRDAGEPRVAETGAALTPGRPAPDFRLANLAGGELSMDDLADRRAILLNFWASWCFPCRAEMPDLIALHEEYESKGLAVIGVTVNDLPRDSRDFVEELKVPYPSVIGTPAMLESYQLSPWLPITLLVKDGRIVREWMGPQTRETLDYPIRVALGLAPAMEDVTSGADHGRH